MDKPLFETTVVNNEGVDGVAYVDEPTGLRVITSSPTTQAPGTNPEELFGLAITTCLNATIQSLLKARGASNKSQVTSNIQLKREQNGIGFYFNVDIYASIENLSLEEATQIILSAEKRCPVSKLTKGAETLTIHTVDYKDTHE
ncbi:OsmC family protein [Marinilactibacillus kalidii]|uniref:OsmC family protein n=1 Tax=Marinilactibacillus kalidii TaxID=2820274 RepID=UPI001FC95B07|nr:OsmC family protein [Marinilactibacillus kalidii]